MTARRISLMAIALLASACAPAATPPLPAIGAVVHATTPAQAAALDTMHIPLARIGYYGDTAALGVELRALAAQHIAPLVVAYAPPIPALAVTWQLGNEPTDLVGAARAFHAAYAARGQFILVPPGVAHGVNVDTLRAAIAAGLGDAGVLCMHAYGTPLAAAVTETIATARAAGWTGRIWLTEIGAIMGSTQSQQLADAIQAARGIERVYVYALWSPDDSYTLTPDARTLITQLLAGGAQ